MKKPFFIVIEDMGLDVQRVMGAYDNEPSAQKEALKLAIKHPQSGWRVEEWLGASFLSSWRVPNPGSKPEPPAEYKRALEDYQKRATMLTDLCAKFHLCPDEILGVE